MYMKKYDEIKMFDSFEGIIHNICDKYYEIKSDSYDGIFHMNKYLSYKKNLNLGDIVKFSVCDKRLDNGVNYISVSCVEYIENNSIIKNIGKNIKAKILKSLDTGVILLLKDYQVCFMAYSSMTLDAKKYDYKQINLVGMNINVYVHSMFYVYGVHVSRKHSKIIRFRYCNIVLKGGSYWSQYKERFNNISFNKLYDMIDTDLTNKKIHLIFKNYIRKQNYNIFIEPISCYFDIETSYYDFLNDKDEKRKDILNDFINNFEKYHKEYLLDK